MEQEINKRYQNWLTNDLVPEELCQEINQLTDKNEIDDRFYRDLSFGTGGLRGKMAAGTNRMNVLTVGKATQGLAQYLKKQFASPSVCIAYDTRKNSRIFAEKAASVLCANGVKTAIFNTVHPTPMLSFAVRYLKASAGIVLTASHNPKEYNGYKVYGPDGGQITDEAAKAILQEINNCDLFADVVEVDIEKAQAVGLLRWIGEDVDGPYFEKVKSLVMRHELLEKTAGGLKIIYSPLHGTGNMPVRRVLKDLGFTQVTVVPEQELPNGDFPTAPYPNPEEPSVFRLAIDMAAETSPDLIFATDPDCDRIGVLVRDNCGSYEFLTGNQTGALLCDYIIQTKNELGEMPFSPAVIKTIVTSDIGKKICEKNGVSIVETLTGFKYIGELAEQWSKTKEHSFLLGFEESYGYLAGDFVRDKDGVIAAVLIAEMALYHKSQGRTLYQALEGLFAQYGFFSDRLISVTMPGKEGQQDIARIMEHLRNHYQELLSEKQIAVWEDYKESLRFDHRDGSRSQLTLPQSNVLKCVFTDDSWFVLRPSGTEPKVKLYLSVCGENHQDAENKMGQLEKMATGLLVR